MVPEGILLSQVIIQNSIDTEWPHMYVKSIKAKRVETEWNGDERRLSVMRLALPGGLPYTLVITVNKTVSYTGNGLRECVWNILTTENKLHQCDFLVLLLAKA